jgi:hydroxypyruvate isomerase
MSTAMMSTSIIQNAFILSFSCLIEDQTVPKLCANISMLFTEVNFLDRFELAAQAGFKGIEYWFPYDFNAGDIMQQLQNNNLQQVLFNLPAGDWAAGERGIACHPGRVEEFRAGIDNAITYALELNCQRCNVLAGIKPHTISQHQAHSTFVSNLKYACGAFKQAGLTLLIESINTFDIPDFFLTTTKQAIQLIAEVGADNLLYQYDIYHMQRMEGNLLSTIQINLANIGHMQLADNPGRHEPGSGEIDFSTLLNGIDSMGYEGWIGAEYNPTESTLNSLNWAKAWLSK